MPPLNRRELLLAVPAAACSLGPSRAQNQAATGTRPNVVFILTDESDGRMSPATAPRFSAFYTDLGIPVGHATCFRFELKADCMP